MIELIPVEGLPEVGRADDVAGMICDAIELRHHDVVVVTQKIVSKAEGAMADVDPDDPLSHKPLVERESVRILRRRGDLIISETKHGFVCANAGIDLSNVASGQAALLPDDPDRSARRIRDAIRGSDRHRGRRDRVRHVRADLAAGRHRRRDRLGRSRCRPRPSRDPGLLRTRAPGHRGRRRRRDRIGRRTGHGQVDRRARGRGARGRRGGLRPRLGHGRACSPTWCGPPTRTSFAEFGLHDPPDRCAAVWFVCTAMTGRRTTRGRGNDQEDQGTARARGDCGRSRC